MNPRDVLSTCIARAKSRLRLRFALEGLSWGMLLAFGGGALWVAVARLRGDALDASLLAATMATVLLVAVAVSTLRRVRDLDVALAIDAHHRLPSSLATGVELARIPAPSPFESLALEGAGERARGVDPRAPFPLRMPRLAPAALAAVGLFAAAFGLPAFTPAEPLAVDAPEPDDPAALEPELVAAFQDELRAYGTNDTDPALEEKTRAIEALLTDLAKGEIEKAEALARLGAILRSFDEDAALEVKKLEADVAELGKSLSSSGSILEDAAKELREAKLGEAAEALEQVASALDRERVLSARERLATQRTLERASAMDEAVRRAERERMEAERRLLEARARAGDSEEERSLLRKKERELEELRRNEESLREDRRRLERLRRDLEDAASRMAEGQDREASEALRRAAESLRDLERFQRLLEQNEALRRLAEQLRDSVRESGQGGEGGEGGQGGRGERLQRFSLRAMGEDGEGGEGGGQRARLRLPGEGSTQDRPGQSGDGERSGQDQAGAGGQGDGSGQEGGSGAQGQARGGESRGQGAEGRGQDGRGQGGQGGSQGDMEITLGGSGGQATAELELSLPSTGKGTEGGRGGGDGTSSYGDGTQDPFGDDASARVRHAESRVEGVSGEGPTRSQLILGAADRGFSSRGYRKVHADYSAHAEELLEDESIPPGYRHYVRRYFQLIRPRDGEAPKR